MPATLAEKTAAAFDKGFRTTLNRENSPRSFNNLYHRVAAACKEINLPPVNFYSAQIGYAGKGWIIREVELPSKVDEDREMDIGYIIRRGVFSRNNLTASSVVVNYWVFDNPTAERLMGALRKRGLYPGNEDLYACVKPVFFLPEEIDAEKARRPRYTIKTIKSSRKA